MSSRTRSDSSNIQAMAYRTGAPITSLPYDLLLAIASHLSYLDVLAVRQTCKSLHEFGVSRPVYRHLAHELLRRCRPLPLEGFTALSDLTNTDLARTIDLASRLELSWSDHVPQRARSAHRIKHMQMYGGGWYTKLRAPPEEEIDWLSPITSSFLLCATRSGKVFCWDIETDRCLSVWQPQRPLELWKCRVEFDSYEVFFTMADVLSGLYEERHMEFTIMCIRFPRPGDIRWKQPEFVALAKFHTHGAVMNVFLLDPTHRVLAAYIWLAESKSIGLYVLPDWDRKEYALLDTTISCSQTGNWSCILHDEVVIIHAEDCDHAAQHLYPLSVIRKYLVQIPEDPTADTFATPAASGTATADENASASEPSTKFKPWLTGILPPPRSIRRRFIFPDTPPDECDTALPAIPHPPAPLYGHTPTLAEEKAGDPANPFRWPDWYPDSCHFVRQWWPASPINSPQAAAARRVSCTVVLLAQHSRETHMNSYVLAQHYFGTPLTTSLPVEQLDAPPPPMPDKTTWRPVSSSARTDGMASAASSSLKSKKDKDGAKLARPKPTFVDGIPLRMWYVSHAFEIVCVLDRAQADDPEEDEANRERPLLAVDFGHAVWVEWYVPDETERWKDECLKSDSVWALVEPGMSRKTDVDADIDVSVGVSVGVEEPDHDENVSTAVQVDAGDAGEVGVEEDVVDDEEEEEEEEEEENRAALALALNQERPIEDDHTARLRRGMKRRLRFSTFPAVEIDEHGHELNLGTRSSEGVVRTLEVPEELDLMRVETINIDQSQGAIFMSVRDGQIFVVYYE